jgi:hypothetical protein
VGFARAQGGASSGFSRAQGTGVGFAPAQGAGSAAFTPTSITGLALWLDASDLTTLWQDSGRTTPVAANSDPVGAWDDKSGNARHFTQATSSKRVSYLTNLVNGLPALDDDGGDDALEGPNAFTGLTAAEVFVVVKVDNDPGGPSADPNDLWQFGTHAAATHYPYSDSNVYDGFGSDTRKSTGNPTLALTSWRLYNVVTTSSEWTSFIDGTQHYTTATNTVAFPTLPRLFWHSATATGLVGNIAELILYNAKLGTTDKDSVESYIASKYALTIA